MTAFNGELYALGGSYCRTIDDIGDIECYYFSTVQHTADGVTWSQYNAPWPERGGGLAFAFDNKLWLFGGTAPYDVWSSPDGQSWTQNPTPPDAAKGYPVVANDKLWMIGGGDGTEVWYTKDCVNWINAGNAPWSPRRIGFAALFQNRIYVIGSRFPSAPLLNDVWYMDLPAPHPWTGFAAQPQDARVYTGSTVALSADPGWTDPDLSFAWRHAGTGLKAAVAVVAGNGPELSLPGVRPADAGQYWCDVTYQGVTHASNTATLTVADHLRIEYPPQACNIAIGGAHTFAVLASGGFQPLTYTWKHNGQPVGSDSTYTVQVLTLQDANLGAYSVGICDSNTDIVESAAVGLTTDIGLPIGGIALALAASCAIVAAAALIRRRLLERNGW